MKIIVIDNEKYWLKRYEKVINKFLIEHNLEIKIISFLEYTNELKNIIYDNEPKIFVIDMELGDDINGYDIIYEIREGAFDWNSLIIIASAYNEKENIISSRLAVYTYILKNKEFENNLFQSIKQAIHILSNNRLIEIKEHHQKYTLVISDILCVKKEKYTKYCIIQTKDYEFRVRTSLSELNKELHFKRLNNYTLVNPIHLKRFKEKNN